MIHKFRVNEDMDYVDTNVVPWSPLSQYSMSEDSHGYFRILTQSWSPKFATHLFILDDDLDLKWALQNIEPDEEFKSSRYIWDKLYLVTFERTDPLFVIDLADPSDPEIIWELKIPGFSTYLHPYAPTKEGKQYLIGLWQDTEENQWWGIVTAGIKLDLYEVDYNEVDSRWQVSISQLYTKTWWERNSTTEALYNPRMFVWDQNRKLVVLPMILSEQSDGMNCVIEYDANGVEVFKDCRDIERYTTTFAWLKAIQIDVDTGIEEQYSYDFVDLLKQDKQVYESWDGSIYPWQFSQLNFRVWYLGDVLYTLNNLFGHFTIMDTDQEVYLPLSDDVDL